MWRFWLICGLLLIWVPSIAQAVAWGGLEHEDPLDPLTPWRDWLVQIGPHWNTFPGGGNDPFNYFGTVQGGIDDYPDSWDVVDPVESGWHYLNLRFTGDEWGDNPTYPPEDHEGHKGLCWDVRMPYARGYKIWRAEIVTEDPGYSYDLVWHLDPFPDSSLAIPPNFAMRLDMDGSFADEPPGDDPRWFDLDNYEIDLRPGYGGPEYIIEGLPQTGEIQVWYIIAGYQTQPIGVPEPPTVALVPLVMGAALPVVRRWRRR